MKKIKKFTKKDGIKKKFSRLFDMWLDDYKNKIIKEYKKEHGYRRIVDITVPMKDNLFKQDQFICAAEYGYIAEVLDREVGSNFGMRITVNPRKRKNEIIIKLDRLGDKIGSIG